MNTNIIPVNSKAGSHFRVLVNDCSNNAITPSDVSRCTYTIYELSGYSTRTPVQGHTDVTVPLSCFISPSQTDPCSGTLYNFDHLISAAVAYPFPNWNSNYIIAYSMFDTDGEPHVHEIYVRS